MNPWRTEQEEGFLNNHNGGVIIIIIIIVIIIYFDFSLTQKLTAKSLFQYAVVLKTVLAIFLCLIPCLWIIWYFIGVNKSMLF